MTAAKQGAARRASGRPVIFGEVLFDRFPDGNAVLGGAPFNVAWHLQGFGAAPLVLARVGDDEPGELVRQSMGEWGMDASGLQLDTEFPTGVAEITFTGGTHSFELLPDQAYDHVSATQAKAAVRELDGALLYHGSLALRTAEARQALAALHEELGAPVFIDTNLRAPWWREEELLSLLAPASWVKVNEEELEIVVDLRGLAGGDLEQSARRLRDEYDFELLIVTCGDKGAFALDRSGNATTVEPTRGAEVADTVGAGDAFASVVLLGLLRGWPMQATMERAQAFASRICGQQGATKADPGLYSEQERAWQ